MIPHLARTRPRSFTPQYRQSGRGGVSAGKEKPRDANIASRQKRCRPQPPGSPEAPCCRRPDRDRQKPEWLLMPTSATLRPRPEERYRTIDWAMFRTSLLAPTRLGGERTQRGRANKSIKSYILHSGVTATSATARKSANVIRHPKTQRLEKND